MKLKCHCVVIVLITFPACLHAQFDRGSACKVRWDDLTAGTLSVKKSCLPDLQKKFQSPPVSDYLAVYRAWNGEMDEAEMARQIADTAFGRRNVPQRIERPCSACKN